MFRLRTATGAHSNCLIQSAGCTVSISSRNKSWTSIYPLRMLLQCLSSPFRVREGMLCLRTTVSKTELMDWVGGSHANTFGGNPVSCAAALQVIGIIRDEHLLENATKQGNYMMKRLREMQEKYPIIGDVRGKGL